MWVLKDYDLDSDPRRCWECATPIGPIVVDKAEWIYPDAPWLASWYPADQGDGISITRGATDAECKTLAEAWLRHVAVGIENVLVLGFNQADDGA